MNAGDDMDHASALHVVDEFARQVMIKQYSAATFALISYEYLITFEAEVNLIWRRKFTFVSGLWFFNRYIVLFTQAPAFIFHFHELNDKACNTFVKFPGVMQMISNTSTGLTLILRTYALYNRSMIMAILLLAVLAGEIAVEAWALVGGGAIQTSKSFGACILSGNPNEGIRFTAFWIGQLVFPTVIAALTVARALKFRGVRAGTLVQVMLRDGVLYFLVVFLINLVNVVVYITAPVGINAINAPLSAALTSMMMCRLMLNLSKSSAASSTRTRTHMPTMEDLTAEFFIGDLGDDLKSGAERDVDGFGEEVELNTRRAHDQLLR